MQATTASIGDLRDAAVRKLSFSDGDETPLKAESAPERLTVWVRVRPIPASTEASEMHLTETAVALRTVKSTAQGRDSVEEVSYTFDGVFNEQSSQAEVFSRAMLPQVRSLFAGRDTLTFAYGITGAGKTHTIQGSDKGDGMGAIPRALECIFRALDAHRAHTSGADAPPPLSDTPAIEPDTLDARCTYELRASFLEVYGNDAFDLLAPEEARYVKDAHGAPKRVALRLKEDRGQVKRREELGGREEAEGREEVGVREEID